MIDRLVIISPYEDPSRHWRYDRDWLEIKLEVKPAAGRVHGSDEGCHDDKDRGDFVPQPLVIRIRKWVSDWRVTGWPGATGGRRRLLD